MPNTLSIPVLDWKEYMPDSDFIINMVDNEDMPARAKVPHRHGGYKILLLLQGIIKGKADSIEYAATAPAIMFTSPERVNQLIECKDISLVHFAFSKDYMFHDARNTLACWEYMFSQISIPILMTKDLQKLKMYANLIQQEFAESSHQKDVVIRNLMSAFLITAARLGTYETNHTASNASQNKILQQFRTLIEVNFLYKTQVADYANMIFVTPGHLNNTIKTATGKTAKQFIDEKRVAEAKRLLCRGELTVKQIGAYLNFEDNAYFNRFFRKHTGKTPVLFQRSIL